MSGSIPLLGLALMSALALLTWMLSLAKRDVSIVDSIWSLMILAGALAYLMAGALNAPRAAIIFALVTLWALRLSVYLTWRNWGEPEDRRYRKIRAKYYPNFALKSLFIIFLLQALIAWFVSLPLWPALASEIAFQPLDYFAAALWTIGMLFEVGGDTQLSIFKANPNNQGKVMKEGLWRYSRHPNYFGEALIWWAFYLFALSSGAWWCFPAPLLMTWLLLKFSGVALLEKDIEDRRPAYREYIRQTNAFIPGPPKTAPLFIEQGKSQ